MRRSDWVARLGGDEFVLYTEAELDRRGLDMFCCGVLACLGAPCRIGSHDHVVTASIGATLHKREGADRFTIGLVSAAWAVGMLAFGSRIPWLAARLGAARAIVLVVEKRRTPPWRSGRRRCSSGR